MSFSAATKAASIALSKGEIDWINDTIYFMAVEESYVYNPYHVNVDDASSHEVTNATGSGYSRQAAGGLNITESSQLSISGITRSGTTATATSTAAHNLSVGDKIYISGANQDEYNGWQTVTAVGSTTTFDFEVAGSPTTPATGTIVADEHIVKYVANNPEYSGIDTDNPINGGWWCKEVDDTDENDLLIFFSRNIGQDGDPRALPTNGSDVQLQVNSNKGVHFIRNFPPEPDPA